MRILAFNNLSRAGNYKNAVKGFINDTDTTLNVNTFWLTADYQYVQNPAYNRERGPVHVRGLRAHFEF